MQPEPIEMQHEPETIEQKQASQLGTHTRTLKPHGLFNTPDSFETIEAWINSHSKEDRLHLWTAAMMTWNYAASIANTGVTEDA